MNLILFNGPPRSGKDSGALAAEDFISQFSNKVAADKFSFPLKAAFAGMMQREMNEDFCVDYFELHKEEIIPSLGVSFRQWQIDFSEKFMKPLYGIDVFARLLLERKDAWYKDCDYLVVSDCGFQIEVDAALALKGFENVLLIRCHRPGFDFKGDSRSYVSIKGAGTWQLDLHNTGTLDQWNTSVKQHVKEWINELD